MWIMELFESNLSKKSQVNQGKIIEMLDEYLKKMEEVTEDKYESLEAWVLKNEFMAVISARK